MRDRKPDWTEGVMIAALIVVILILMTLQLAPLFG